jgi:hypothetical protein
MSVCHLFGVFPNPDDFAELLGEQDDQRLIYGS